MSTNTIIISGNLAADPELRFTASGKAVANFTVADTPRHQDADTGEWRDGEPLFQRCAAWGPLAENIAESLTRGMSVIVTGRLTQKVYETSEGEKKGYSEIRVDDLGVSLKRATAAVTKTNRSK